MSINTAMTAIADKIRGLLGLSGAMGLDAMASNLAVEQTNIADAYTVVSSKGGTVPESKVSGNLAAAIRTISTGGLDTSDATATAADILAGKTAYVNGNKVTGSIASRSAQTITPGTSDQTIASGQYLSGKQTIKGDANLLPGNIKSGVSVFGVDGAYVGTVDIDTSDATATADDMAKGKTAYVNGQKITGTLYEFTENTTEILGHQNTEVSQKTIDGVQYLLVRGQTTGKGVMRIGSWAKVRTPLSTLGDASASDVAAGKTFTSSAGLKVTGTHECSGGIDTSDATATANDIAADKTAYVNGKKITGSAIEYPAGDVGLFEFSELAPVNSTQFLRVSGTLSASSGKSSIFRPDSIGRIFVPYDSIGDATAADVAKGKTFTSAAGVKVAGTHKCAAPSLQSKMVTPSESQQTVSPDSGYDGLSSVTVGAVSRTYVGTGVTKKSAATYTPGTSDQTIASGQYLSGTQTIKGDANLLASNIKSGVSIFGVAGIYEGSGASSIQTQHITSTSDTITISGTGTVKVWGYGYKSAQYAGTTYAFVGDGYYSGSYHGQPSKTSATFSISDGKLSGLPSGLTAMDLLVTIGI